MRFTYLDSLALTRLPPSLNSSPRLWVCTVLSLLSSCRPLAAVLAPLPKHRACEGGPLGHANFTARSRLRKSCKTVQLP